MLPLLRRAAPGLLMLLVSVHPVCARGPIRLEVDAPPPDCPDVGALRRSVIDQLGHDPFVAAAPRVFTVRWRRDGVRLVADLTVREGALERGRRRLVGRMDECAALHRAVGLLLTLALDPLRLGEPLPVGVTEVPPEPETALVTAPPTVVPVSAASTPAAPVRPETPLPAAPPTVVPVSAASTPAAPVRRPETPLPAAPPTVVPVSAASTSAAPVRPPPAPPTPSAPGEPLVFGQAVSLGASWGLTPGVAIAGRYALRWSGSPLLFGAGLVGAFGTGTPAAGGRVVGALLGGELMGGGRLGGLEAMVAVTGGWLPAWGDGFSRDARADAPFASVGLRVAYALSIIAGLKLQPVLEIGRPLVGARLLVDDVAAWQTPPILGAIGLEAVF